MTILHKGIELKVRPDRPSFLRPGFISLRTTPCSWNRCIFCGFSQGCIDRVPTVEQIVEQIRYSLDHFQDTQDSWSILNKGSFFDNKQITERHRLSIAKYLASRNVRRVFIESRPDFVTEEALREFHEELGVDKDLAVGLGLEVSDERILNFIKKGTSLRSFEKCVRLLERQGVTCQAFLMAGLPGAIEPETTLESVRYAKRVGSDQVMVSATVPRRGTELRDMWKRGEWQPIDITLFSQIVDAVKTIFEPEDVDVWLCGIQAFQKEKRRERDKRYRHNSTRDQLRIEDFVS